MGEGGAERSEAPGEGLSSELSKQIDRHAFRVAQHIVIPIAHYPEPFAYKSLVPQLVSRRVGVLPDIDFDDDAAFITDKIQNIVSECNLPTEFEISKPSIAKDSP